MFHTSVQSEVEVEAGGNEIKNLEAEKRQDVLVDARALEHSARDGLIEGLSYFAAISTRFAEAIRLNADALAHDDLTNAERVLQALNGNGLEGDRTARVAV